MLSSEKTKYLVQFMHAPSFIYQQLDYFRSRMEPFLSVEQIAEIMAYLTSMFASQIS